MNDRSNLISKLKSNFKARTAYVQAKVATLVPSQIRALRLKSEMPRQSDLAHAAEMHQSRISMFETPGANPTLSTLSSIAAALNVGLKVEFVPFSEMLAWENSFSQDQFDVVKLDEDYAFLNPRPVQPINAASPGLANPAVPFQTAPTVVGAFTEQMNLSFDRYALLAGSSNILTGASRIVVSEPVGSPCPPQTSKNLLDSISYRDVPLSLLAAKDGGHLDAEQIS